MTSVFAISAGLMFGVSLYGVLARRHLIQRLVAANVMASTVFLYLVVLSVREGEPADPVPRAMVLTGIVVAVSITAFALKLARWLQEVGPSRHSDGQRQRPTPESAAPAGE